VGRLVALLAVGLAWYAVRRFSAVESTRAAHDEWLLDEALAETFPASDPISPSRRT
jgi:hypothetical protein